MAGTTQYAKRKWAIADVSWRDMLAQDPYYGLANSFQYSENINCDDELHGIKLSQRIMKVNDGANCQLVRAGNKWVFVIPKETGSSAKKVKYFMKNSNPNGDDALDLNRFPGTNLQDTGLEIPANCKVWEAVIFQDNLRVPIDNWTNSYFKKVNVQNKAVSLDYTAIRDHIEDSDESISHISSLGVTTLTDQMGTWISQVLNFNNTRLVCGVWEDLRVYYPELDNYGESQYDPSTTPPGMRTVARWETGWKKVQWFEAGCEIVGLTCDFEYLKVWVTDEGWNTKMYYYPGNNDLRNTFVYNIIDMTGTKVLRTYNINGVDYFTASLDWTDGYITFNKVIWDTPVQLFTQRGWLSKYDANQKAWYFVGPTSRASEYQNGSFYIGDAYGVFKFAFTPGGYDKGYLKRKIRSTGEITTGLCIAWNFVFISDEHGIKAMRLYDTGIDWYEAKGILVSREMEWDFGGCVAKVLDEVLCHFELNPLIKNSDNAGDIDIYMSPNNKWKNVDPEADSTGWWHVLHIDGDSDLQNRNTRYESINKLNCMNNGNPAFEFDRETITYCVVIKRWKSTAQWTPVVREVYMNYHTKGKVNDVYEITN